MATTLLLLLMAVLSLAALSCADGLGSDLQTLYFVGVHPAGILGGRGGLVRRRDRVPAATPLRVIAHQDLVDMPARHGASLGPVLEKLGAGRGGGRAKHRADDGDDRVENRADDRVKDRAEDGAEDGAGDRAGDRVDVRVEDRADDRADDAVGPAAQPAGAEQDDDGGDEDLPAVLDGVDLVPVRGKKSPVEDEAGDDEDEEDDVEDDDVDVGYLDGAKASGPEPPLPFWHLPCGRSINLVVRRPKGGRGRSARTVTRRINEALERVWRQLNMTVLHYRLQRFDRLYYRVVIGVNEDHYIPSWVPDRKDLPKLAGEDFQSSHKLAHELTRMHSQLQKFAVALEHISEDNRMEDPLRHSALSKTKNYVKMLLCEVEWSLLSLAIPLPLAVPREIMSPSEMNMTDDTNRDIRDWGVLVKYRDFLHGWSDILAQSGLARAQAEVPVPERRRGPPADGLGRRQDAVSREEGRPRARRGHGEVAEVQSPATAQAAQAAGRQRRWD